MKPPVLTNTSTCKPPDHGRASRAPRQSQDTICRATLRRRTAACASTWCRVSSRCRPALSYVGMTKETLE
eukprot:5577518-Prymnesium_polylepis.1